MAANQKLRVTSFNCRGFKSSVSEVSDICNISDLVLIQEHWLLPFELDKINNAHFDYLATSKSAIDLTDNILLGRPYGGTAILYRKSLAGSICVLDSHDPRIAAVKLMTNIGPIIFLCVYMPVDLGHSDCLESYIETCANIRALYTECDAVHLVIMGDFNCQPHSRFYDIMLNLAEDNNLQISDIKRLSNVVTYCSDDGLRTSWIDHCLCSQSVDECISSVEVLYQFISSDHKPLKIHFDNIRAIASAAPQSTNSSELVYDWSKANDYNMQLYQSILADCLNNVNIPVNLFRYSDHDGCAEKLITEYYEAIVNSINNACNRSIPGHIKTCADHIVPGWNDFVKDKHCAARDAFLQWASIGRPRYGYEFTLMVKTRAMFKLALRYCRQNEETLRADSLASSLSDKDYRSFWHNVYKQSNASSTKFANVIGGCTGDVDIANMWSKHFEQLYNSVHDDGARKTVIDRLDNSTSLQCFSVSISDVVHSLTKQKCGKAVGHDGIAMEALMFGGNKLAVHICLLFNLFIKYCYLPSNFMNSVIIPLVKCKSGDLTDVNNYRAIAISTAFSKLFECLVADQLSNNNDNDRYQFGFKAGHSTALCTSVFKRTVEYYINRGSHVFACFIDFTKAFDKVNYWKLFNKLLDDNVDSSLVRILIFWYSKQEICVRWHTVVSKQFTVGNGTRQGGVLSPYLFTRYIRDLLSDIESTKIGCNIGGMFINVLAYADDMVLLTPSWRAMQLLLDVLLNHITIIDMTCNSNKTVCMVFNPVDRSKCIARTFPLLTLGGTSLQYVDEFKYLGHLIVNDLTDDRDISREIRNMFVRTNILIRRFSRCSIDVKVALFKSYCLCLYDPALWKFYTRSSFNKLMSCYNKCVKTFFGYKRRDSMSQVLTTLNLPSFNTVVINSTAIFGRSYCCSDNSIVRHLRTLGY